MKKFDSKMQEFNYYVEKAKAVEKVNHEEYIEYLTKAKEVYEDAKKEAIEYENKKRMS